MNDVDPTSVTDRPVGKEPSASIDPRLSRYVFDVF